MIENKRLIFSVEINREQSIILEQAMEKGLRPRIFVSVNSSTLKIRNSENQMIYIEFVEPDDEQK